VVRCHFNATRASRFSNCTLMCKVYVCDRDATAGVAVAVAVAVAGDARRYGRWWRWCVLVGLARLSFSLSRVSRRDAQSDPGVRLGLSIACTAAAPSLPLSANAVTIKAAWTVASICRADLRLPTSGADGCQTAFSGPGSLFEEFYVICGAPEPSCLASTSYYSWRPTLFIKQPAHQGPRALACRLSSYRAADSQTWPFPRILHSGLLADLVDVWQARSGKHGRWGRPNAKDALTWREAT
jgi:hypothetical protein